MKSQLLVLRLALSGILENKTRTILTMFGIIIGIASVITIMSVGAGAESLITSSVKKIGTNLVGVLPGASNDNGPPASAMGIAITTLTIDDARAVAKLPNIEGVSAYSNGTGEVVAEKESIDGTFNGVTADYPMVENHIVQRGRFFTTAEERASKKVAVLGSELQEDLFPHTDPIGKTITIRRIPFRVIGVLEKKGASLVNNPDTQLFIPLSTAQKILLGVRHIGLMRIKIDNEKNVNSSMERIRRLLRQRHDIKNAKDDDFSVRSLSQAVEILSGITSALRFFLASIAAISLVVGGIGITNIMLMSVTERTREIGLKKAIGARPSQIQGQFLLEAVLLTGTGGILGILFGVFFSFVIAAVAWHLEYDWVFSVSLLSMGISFLVALFVGIVFGLSPARRAAKLKPIDALRYE
ncbi:ABC transporter permease [Candidatus Peregrinibacteria bacterium]|nr:MAG: ABC transporter permease [Candidatus Peregrinibacteria bacterium]